MTAQVAEKVLQSLGAGTVLGAIYGLMCVALALISAAIMASPAVAAASDDGFREAVRSLETLLYVRKRARSGGALIINEQATSTGCKNVATEVGEKW
jgi:hypothetical protein